MSAPKVVIYAAKSTEDRHGSIPTQIEDCRALAERSGWEVAGVFQDEGFSAYKGNRGPGFDAAKALALSIAEAGGSCILVAQDADRFARGSGDAPGAADHLGELFFRMKRGRVSLWSVRSGELDLLRAVLEGERSNDESARKKVTVRGGLQRRKERGQPVGRMPFGYRVEHEVVNGRPVATRIPDERMAPIVRRAFDLAESGLTDGEIARTFNAEALTTQHGNPFRRQTIQMILTRDHYVGEHGYGAIVDREQWDRVNGARQRQDPVRQQVRGGGRPPSQRFLLRQIANCERCGTVLGCSSRRGRRWYQCRRAMESVGACDAPPIPAEVLEAGILNHLGSFVGSTGDWLAQQLESRDELIARDQAAIDELSRKRLEVERLRGKVLEDYRELSVQDSPAAQVALSEVVRIDEELAQLDELRSAAEARAEAHRATPDVDAALDLYSRLGEIVNDRLDDALGDMESTNRALRGVLAGLWVEHDKERRRLLVRFELLMPESERFWLPPVRTDRTPIVEPLSGAPTRQPTVTPC
ncbi:MAG: recombinase family protein [Solirubrobacteraceae bacterium]|nr:recombinase family protein [Solirubrobacteraceae bacterium]